MKHEHEIRINGFDLVFTGNNQKTNFWLKWRFRRKSIHEKKVVELLLNDIKSDMCFVDVGAYLGFYSVLTSKCLTDGEVISFEMDKNSFKALNENLKINDCNNVSISNKAVTDYIGTAKYVTNGLFTSALSRLDKQVEAVEINNKKTIETTTLDYFFKDDYDKPDIIKIDVEGAEMNVLIGMEEILEKNKKLILFIEIHPKLLKQKFKFSEQDVFEKLMSYGFNLYQIRDLRKLKKENELRKLDIDSKLKTNSMIYARR